MPDIYLPEHGAHLRLNPRDALEPIDIVLDVGRALLHVLRDAEGSAPWEGRAVLDVSSRAMWDRRLMTLSEGGSAERAVAILAWRAPMPGGQLFGERTLDSLRTHAREGAVAFARDLCAQALRTRIDHPLAAQALSQWNQVLNFAPTVQFAEGAPRRIRLQGIIDGSGLANLSAMARVLRQGEPLIIDLTGCASLGAWDPAELLGAHTIAWVSPPGGIADHLVDIGVPREAFHGTERAARAWLRG